MKWLPGSQGSYYAGSQCRYVKTLVVSLPEADYKIMDKPGPFSFVLFFILDCKSGRDDKPDLLFLIQLRPFRCYKMVCFW